MGIFGGSSGDDLEIKVTLDTKSAESSASELDQKLNTIGSKTGSQADAGLSSMIGKLAGVGAAVYASKQAFDALGGALDNALQVENLTAGFENLQKKIGTDSVASMQALQVATGGLVSKMDLMTSANQAVLLGVDDGSGKFAGLAAAASKLGKAMGIDAKSALDSLVVGLGRGSKLVLDNLGIIVDTEAAYRKYAATLGITAEKLTDGQKKQAFQNAGMEEAARLAADLDEPVRTAAGAYAEFKVALKDAYDQATTSASGNSILEGTLTSLTAALKGLPSVINDVDRALVDADNAYTDFALSVAEATYLELQSWLALGTVNWFKWGSAAEYAEEKLKKLKDEVLEGQRASRAGSEENLRFSSSLTAITTEAAQAADQVRDLRAAQISSGGYSLAGAMKEQGDAVKFADVAFKGLNLEYKKYVAGSGEATKATKETKKHVYELVDITKMLSGKLLSNDLKKQVDELGDGFKKQNTSMEQVDKTLEALRKGYVTMGLTAQEVDSILKGIDLISKPKESLEAYFKLQVQQDKLKLSVKEISRQYQDHNIDLGEATKKLIGLSDEYVKLGLTVEQADSIIKGADFTAPLKDNLLNQIPDFLGKMITESITNGLENGLNAETLKGLGSSVASIFANEFQANFSKVFAKDAAGNLTGGIDFGALGSSAASLGMAYGVSSLTQNLSDNKKDTQGGIIGGAVLGASYGSTFGPWGALVGGVVGAGAGYVAGTTGKSTEEGSVSRKETVNWIEDRINNLYLPFLKEQGNIILGDNRRFSENTSGGWFTQGMRYVDETAYRLGEGALGSDTRLGAGGYVHGERYDPVPGQIEGGDWATKYWDKFGQEGGNTFQALAAAMQNFSGQTTEEMGKIAVVIAENLNGNLDNARLLLQTMGVSAEDLTTAFMNIGLAGEETWLTVEGFFQKIPALTGEGLIGLGDVAGALNQIDDAAGRGGAALIGLTNAAIEVQEAGGKSLDDFRTMLLGTGKEAKDVDIIMQALAGRGINSLDDLRNAADRTLGGVTADMDALGYTFSDSMTEGTDAAIAELEKLQKAVKDIPQDTEKNLTINVKTKYSDDQARGALNQINGGSSGLGIARQ